MIHTIINEEIQRVLKENYFASRYEKECRETAERIMKKLNYEIYEREQSNEKMFFYIIDYLSIPYQDSNEKFKIDITIWYDKKRPLNKFFGAYYYEMNDMEIQVGENVTYDNIYGILQHELTHALDYMLNKQKRYSIKMHEIQPFDTGLENKKIEEIMYRLWDTSEFNAHQASTYDNYHNALIEKMMKLLNDVYYDDTIDWMEVGSVIRHYTDRITKYTKPETIKKYFFDTSFKKLKKFIRKTI